MHGELWFDGGCWPNPGPAHCAYVLKVGGKTRLQRRFDLGETTNNTAEFMGLINGLWAARREGCTSLQVRGDSQLVIYVASGRWKGHKPHIKALKVIAQALIGAYPRGVSLQWVRREFNQEADTLCGVKGPY